MDKLEQDLEYLRRKRERWTNGVDSFGSSAKRRSVIKKLNREIRKLEAQRNEK